MTRAALLALTAWLTVAPAMAASSAAADFSWRTDPGAQMPLDTTLRDEGGRSIPFRALFGRVPVILDLGYFLTGLY